MKRKFQISPNASQWIQIHPTVGVVLGLTVLYVMLLFMPFFVLDSANEGLHAGIVYDRRPFELMLQQGEQDDRMCFVKFYSKYCYPCDVMDHELLTDPELIDLLQENFMTYKIDGLSYASGGIELSRKYEIKTYPTILITNPSGVEKMRVESSIDIKSLKDALHDILLGKNIASVESKNHYPLRYGLIIESAKGIAQAKYLAEKQTHMWDHGVWIYPRNAFDFDIVIGDFATKNDAKATAKFINEWENKNVDIIQLKNQPIKFLSSQEAVDIPSAQFEN